MLLSTALGAAAICLELLGYLLILRWLFGIAFLLTRVTIVPNKPKLTEERERTRQAEEQDDSIVSVLEGFILIIALFLIAGVCEAVHDTYYAGPPLPQQTNKELFCKLPETTQEQPEEKEFCASPYTSWEEFIEHKKMPNEPQATAESH